MAKLARRPSTDSDYLPGDSSSGSHGWSLLNEQWLGSGAFSVVCVGKLNQKSTDDSEGHVAVKTISKVEMADDELRLAMREVHVMRLLQHRGCVSLVGMVDSETSLQIAMEWMRGGDLLEVIRSDKPVELPFAFRVLEQISSAIKHLHEDNDVVHRDIKLENILCCDLHDTFKLADFGSACVVQDGELLDDLVGTPGYVAPEVVAHEMYGKSCDLFGLGVVLFAMFAKRLPFEHHSLDEAYCGEWACGEGLTVPFEDDEIWEDEELDYVKSLVEDLLQAEPAQRLTASTLSMKVAVWKTFAMSEPSSSAGEWEDVNSKMMASLTSIAPPPLPRAGVYELFDDFGALIGHIDEVSESDEEDEDPFEKFSSGISVGVISSEQILLRPLTVTTAAAAV